MLSSSCLCWALWSFHHSCPIHRARPYSNALAVPSSTSVDTPVAGKVVIGYPPATRSRAAVLQLHPRADAATGHPSASVRRPPHTTTHWLLRLPASSAPGEARLSLPPNLRIHSPPGSARTASVRDRARSRRKKATTATTSRRSACAQTGMASQPAAGRRVVNVFGLTGVEAQGIHHGVKEAHHHVGVVSRARPHGRNGRTEGHDEGNPLSPAFGQPADDGGHHVGAGDNGVRLRCQSEAGKEATEAEQQRQKVLFHDFLLRMMERQDLTLYSHRVHT